MDVALEGRERGKRKREDEHFPRSRERHDAGIPLLFACRRSKEWNDFSIRRRRRSTSLFRFELLFGGLSIRCVHVLIRAELEEVEIHLVVSQMNEILEMV